MVFKSKLFFFLIVTTLCFQNIYAEKYDKNIINISFLSTDTIVIINKKETVIDIIQIDSNKYTILKSVNICPLENLDNKNLSKETGTPEGIYFINEEIFLKDYNVSEKKIALVLNYPNAADKYNKRTGTNIWIQSVTSNDRGNLSCFYLEEENFAQLLPFIKKNNTPIVIIKESNGSKLFKNSLEFSEFLNHWKSTLSSKMLVEHSKMYIAENDQLDFEYAESINKVITSEDAKYKINIDNVIVLQTEEESRISFRFRFQSDEYRLDKQFCLALLSVGNEWKIFSENAKYNPEIILSDEEKIKELVFKWKESWETKNFDKFIALYSKNFSDDNRNYNQFSRSKRNAFENLGEIKVSIKEINIEKITNQYRITFIQDYWTKNYNDVGVKTLILERFAEDFQIIHESWSEITKLPPEPSVQLSPKEKIVSIIQQWKTNWEGKNFSQYISLYSTEYSDSNYSYHEFFDYKRNAFKNQNQIKVTIDSLQIIEKENQYKATFIQNYWTTEYQDIGLKTMIFNEKFLIINETWKEISDEVEEVVEEPKIQLPPKEHIAYLINQWKTNWESKNFDKYISFYSASYEDNDRNYRQFRNHKRKAFQNSNSIKVEIKNLEISEMGTRWIATFIQNYKTPNYSDTGEKTIIFNKDFKIIHENWKEVSDEQTELKIDLPSKEYISFLIEQWEQNWEMKNFDKFISLYSETYADTNRTYREFYYYKRGLFKKSKNINVAINDLQIEEVDNLWLATFIQEYTTTTYHDKGIKRIIFKKFGDKYLIVNETWEEIID